MRLLVEFGFEAIARATRAVAVGIAALDHKPRLNAVEGEPIVEAFFGKLHKSGRVHRSVVREKREDDVTFVGGNTHAGFTSALGVGFDFFGSWSSSRHVALLHRPCFVPSALRYISTEMPEKPTLHVQIPPDPQYARTVRGALAAFASLHGVVELDLAAVVLAVGEALANAIEHAAPQGDIKVTVEIDRDVISARIVDSGRGFDQTPLALEPLPDDDEEGGRGIPIMQRCVDQWNVESSPGLGTIVTLRRLRRDAAPTDQERAAFS